MKKIVFIFLFLLNLGCTPYEYQNFLTQKEISERKFGPCDWDFVGFDDDLDHPAIALKPLITSDFVLWNQVCNKIE